MHPTILLAALSLTTAGLTAQQTLVFTSKYETDSLDANAALLRLIGPFDIGAVTPGAGATAHPILPAAGLSAMIGDPDDDADLAEFAGLPAARFGIGEVFVKDADRKSGDARKIYWTVRENVLNPPPIEVFEGNAKHRMRVGDFVRLGENGEAEFFIKQEQIMKAAGGQTGSYVPGCSSLCQSAAGDLFYSPAHGIIAGGGRVAGGHWVNKPTKIFAFDGAIVRIAAADITYDAKGNVQDVKADSAIIVANEVGGAPTGLYNVREMCGNSGAVDANGNKTTITYWMQGLSIDPNGGTFVGWYEANVPLPNLIFTWGRNEWRGTIYSTANNSNGTAGSIAKINGRDMGQTTGMADGSWTGLQSGSGGTWAPVLRGLDLMESGYKATAPYGNAAMQASNRGAVSLATDKKVDLAVQGELAGFPIFVAAGFGIAKGGRPASLDFSSVWNGFGGLYATNVIDVFSLPSNGEGRAFLSIPLGTDPRLVGLNFVFQGVALGAGAGRLTNPVIVEVRT